MILVNQVYLIFKHVHFLVDSSVLNIMLQIVVKLRFAGLVIPLQRIVFAAVVHHVDRALSARTQFLQHFGFTTGHNLDRIVFFQFHTKDVSYLPLAATTEWFFNAISSYIYTKNVEPVLSLVLR